MLRASLAPTLMTLALALGGCEISSGFFDPRGSDVALRTSGPWQIDGVPADAAVCAAANLDRVDLVFIDLSPSRADDYRRDDSREYRYREFSFPCADGRYESDGPVLAYGTYVARWSGVDGNGDEKFSSSAFVIDADLRDVATIPAPAFTNGGGGLLGIRVDVAWDTDPSAAFGAGDCDDAEEVTSVRYELYDITADPEELVDEARNIGCVNQLFFEEPDFELDASHEYELVVSGGPSDDEPYWTATCSALSPSTDGTDECEVADVRPRLRVVFQWDKTSGDGFSAGTCAESSAELLETTIVLRDSEGATVQEFSNVSCVNERTFEAPDVEVGEIYSVEVTGGATEDAQTWASTCTNLTPGAGAPEEYACMIQRP